MFEKIIFNYLYKHLTTHPLITKNKSGFRPGDSTTNHLIDFVDAIHQAFHSTKSLEVRAVFLDISKAFDKVWHDGLIQNEAKWYIRQIIETFSKLSE